MKLSHTFAVLAYRESPFLEECVKSVLVQSAASQVFICTATPNAYIDSVAARHGISVAVNPGGGAIGADWNFGLSQSKADLVTLAHQDDIYDPSFVEAVTAAAAAQWNKRPLILFNPSVELIRDGAHHFSRRSIARYILTLPFLFSRAQCGMLKKLPFAFFNSISCPGVTYVKNNCAGFSFNEQDQFVLDWRAWVDLSKREGAFVYIPRPLHTHRIHEGSQTTATGKKAAFEEEYALLLEIWGDRFIAKALTCLLTLK